MKTLNAAVHRALAPAFLAVVIGATALPAPAPRAADDVVVGFIGSLASDTGLSTLRGAEIAIEETPDGRAVSVTGEAELAGRDVSVPGDPSSAAFLVAAPPSPPPP